MEYTKEKGQKKLYKLFEIIKEKIIKYELSKKPLSKKKSHINLSKYCKVKLYKGYSNHTLPKLKNVKADFIFIDGGHRVKTIKSDWKNCLKLIKRGTVIIFDDYYLENKKLSKNFGCNKIVNSISSKKFKKKLYNITDKFSYHGFCFKFRL